MLSILSLGLIKALSGLNETLVLSPLDLTDIGFAIISALASLTLHLSPDKSEVSEISGGKCKVKLANAEIMANPISIKSKGEKTKVSLRPERALINPNDKMDNIHNGKIEEVIYHGDHTRVRINLLGNPEFILKVPNSSANLDIKLGNEIKIGWNSEDARALDPK